MPSEDSNLLAVERQRMIVDILRREGAVRNAELKELLGVSLVTIRSDLRELERQGECEIIWGGAVSKTPPTEYEVLLSERSQLHPEVKRRIGAKAATLVTAGQTVIIDAGSTAVEVVNNLSHELDYLRIVTPALNVATATAHFPNVELLMTGGILRHLTRSLVGPQVIRSLDRINADWTFLASGGFSIETGVTTSNMLEVEVKRTMVKQAKNVVLVADSSKYGHIRSLHVADLNELSHIITDNGLSDADVDDIQALGVEVLRV